jgi:GT2 family glycosyltransferase
MGTGETLPLTERDLNPYINCLERYGKEKQNVLASVIIVAYNTNQELLCCLDSLRAQTCSDFEIFIMDNGRNEAVQDALRNYEITYCRMKRNYTPSLPRNVASVYARGKILCFLDDDGLADENFVAAHLTAHREYDIVGLRGRILPKTPVIYNSLAPHYDYGPEVLESYVELEGNSSFDRDLYIKVGGYRPAVFHSEGVEISYRIMKRLKDRSKLIYYPDAVIYHDYASDFKKYIRKTIQQARMTVLTQGLHPEINEYIWSYKFPPGRAPVPETQIDRLRLSFLRRLGYYLRWTTIKWGRLHRRLNL